MKANGIREAGVDLLDELVVSQRALSKPQKAALESLGVPRKMWQLGLIGAAQVTFQGATFQPLDNGDGEPVILVPVKCDPDHPWSFETADPAGAVLLGDVIDIVAFPLMQPMRFALRRDAATVLGAVVPQYLGPEPVKISRSPLSWLRNGATGLCPLTRRPNELQQILLKCHRIHAEDYAHARELRRIAERPCRIPEIVVAPSAKRAA
jgi:hypothetical protein